MAQSPIDLLQGTLDLIVLKTLSWGPMHGFGIARWIQLTTDEVLQVEDIALVESVQRGLRSRGYDQGRFIVDAGRTDMSEHAVHHFHALVVAAMARGQSPV